MKSTVTAPSAARVAEALKEIGEMEEYIRQNLVIKTIPGVRVELDASPGVRSDLLSYVAQARSYLTVREGA